MNNKKELEQAAQSFCEQYADEFVMQEARIALVTLLAAQRAAVLEDVRARIIAAHRMGDRDEWLDVAAWCRRKAEERQS